MNPYLTAIEAQYDEDCNKLSQLLLPVIREATGLDIEEVNINDYPIQQTTYHLPWGETTIILVTQIEVTESGDCMLILNSAPTGSFIVPKPIPLNDEQTRLYKSMMTGSTLWHVANGLGTAVTQSLTIDYDPLKIARDLKRGRRQALPHS